MLKRGKSIFVILAAVILAVTACSPTAPAVDVEAPAAPAESANETSAEEVTMVVWDIMSRPEESAIVEALIAEFEAAHPGVTIEREAKSLDDLKATSALAMSGEGGPDIIQVNQGESDMGAMVKAGLLEPLNDYAEEYGWLDTFPAGLAGLNSWTDDGSQMGQGNLYGLPLQAEIVGVYYRTDIFEEQGLKVPTTYAEFEEVMAALSEAGIVPITFGNLDGWPAIHLYSEIQNVELVGREWYDRFMFTKGDVTFDVPENVTAAEKLVGWVDNGYLTPGFEGIGYDDSWQLFLAGEGAMMLTGSWMAGEFVAGDLGEQIGFFLVPPVEAGGYKLTVGGTGAGFAIRKGSPNAALAAEYLDYLYSENTAIALAKAGFLPVYPIDPSFTDSGLPADVTAAWGYAIENDGIGYYMDWVTPTMYDTISGSLQELMAGNISAEEFVAAIDADYTAFLVTK